MNTIAQSLEGIYCRGITRYARYKTREVMVGSLGIGGNNPIRLQSMTTTDTLDIKATVEQSIRMIDAGCELVRITAPSIKEAQALEQIKKELRNKGYNTPLVADIHYTPNAAELAARIVEKVRVNPGNYADKKKFESIDYSDASYEAELERIRKRFMPLVKICKEYGTAMRIGTNHGSLSDRIMSRYGDSPLGMVESALEFVRICEENKYHNIVLSMKASNAQVMVQAYRLLVKKMTEEGMNYPLHLGVTEAGEGEDGRIKSAVGIGTLLEDGLGDTIRVSLTEDPEFEIPVAKTLAERYSHRSDHPYIPPVASNPVDPFNYSRRLAHEVQNIGGKQVPVVVSSILQKEKIIPANLFALGYHYAIELDKWNIKDMACDYLYVGNSQIDFQIPGTLGIIQNHKNWNRQQPNFYPLISTADYLAGAEKHSLINFIEHNADDISGELMTALKTDKTAVLMLGVNNPHGMAAQRRFIIELMNTGCTTPVIIRRKYQNLNEEHLQLYAATDAGALLTDGLGDGIFIDAYNSGPAQVLCQTAFCILQATRTRISKTEYISCPSCGRTLFDLQETTAKIRARTHHLKGVKIGIMGCIVNGPGEMADADYGYVGTGPGKITLYKGKEVVKRNVPSEKAVDELIELIRQHGDWVEQT